jgi:hypothetical protein
MILLATMLCSSLVVTTAITFVCNDLLPFMNGSGLVYVPRIPLS